MQRYRRMLVFLVGMLAAGGAFFWPAPALAQSGTQTATQSRLVVFEAFMRDT